MSLFGTKDRSLSKGEVLRVKADLDEAYKNIAEAAGYGGIISVKAEKAEGMAESIRGRILRIIQLEEKALQEVDPTLLIEFYRRINLEAERIDYLTGELFSYHNKYYDSRLSPVERGRILQKIRFLKAELADIQQDLSEKFKKIDLLTKGKKAKVEEYSELIEEEQRKGLKEIEEIHQGNLWIRRAAMRFTRYGKRMAGMVNDTIKNVRGILNKSYRKAA